MDWLIKNGAKIDEFDFDGKTPLHLAVKTDGIVNMDIVDLLLKNGANINLLAP